MKSALLGIFASALLLLLCGLSIAQGSASTSAASPTPQAQQNGASNQSTPNRAANQAGQSMPSNAQQGNVTHRIAPGSVIPVQLTKSIDAKKVKTGDEVEAKVTEDMKAGNGDVVVPKDTKVMGRVTEAQARNKEQKESQLGIAFDHAVMKSGDVAMPMSVQAIISQSYLSGDTNGGGGEGAGQAAAQSASTPSAGGMPSANPGRGGMGAAQASAPTSASGPSAADNGNNKTRQPVNGQTEGVLGYPNLKLAPAADAAQGSVVSSEKNNVKLDTGTLMLLRVNQ